MCKRLLVVLSLVVVLSLAGSLLAYAGYNWEDPALEIAGQRVMVEVWSEIPDGQTVSRVTRVWVNVPRGVDAQVVDEYGTETRLVRVGRYEGGKLRFQVVVLKPRTDRGASYPVTVKVVTPDQTFVEDGSSGRPIAVAAWLPAPQ